MPHRRDAHRQGRLLLSAGSRSSDTGHYLTWTQFAHAGPSCLLFSSHRPIRHVIFELFFLFQASNSNLSATTEGKDTYAKEIVSSIITAARKKRQTSLDSPDLSERGDALPVLPVSATKTIAEATVPTGSAHSLVELGSTGGQPALPVEASEFRPSSGETSAAPTLERKRSASLGGETVMPPPPNMANDLAGITEMVADGAQASGTEFRSRTSSGSFVVNKPHPIDAAGIRSYSGLSAVTQERIRLFEQVKRQFDGPVDLNVSRDAALIFTGNEGYASTRFGPPEKRR